VRHGWWKCRNACIVQYKWTNALHCTLSIIILIAYFDVPILLWILMKQEMMGWQWHHMQITCTLLRSDNHASMLFLMPNQLCQSTEGTTRWLVPNYIAWWRGHNNLNNLPGVSYSTVLSVSVKRLAQKSISKWPILCQVGCKTLISQWTQPFRSQTRNLLFASMTPTP